MYLESGYELKIRILFPMPHLSKSRRSAKEASITATKSHQNRKRDADELSVSSNNSKCVRYNNLENADFESNVVVLSDIEDDTLSDIKCNIMSIN